LVARRIRGLDARRLLAFARKADTADSGAMTSVRALLTRARDTLRGNDATREAEILVAHALGRDRAWLFAHSDDAVTATDADAVMTLATLRAGGEPIAYLTGHREFWTLDLHITSDVLIPREDTELLVRIALQHCPQGDNVEIADLGTGSGAIALAIARERPRAHVLALDSSAAALDVARSNAERLRIGNVEFVCSDWFATLTDRRFDVIVSNPPYIASRDAHLTQGDLRFEPTAALASGSDGLDAIRHIVRESPAHLRDDGMLAMEHGFEQAAAVRELLQQSGFAEIYTERDFGGRDRVSGGFVRRSARR
jgi:release factor glutamine methyltransferase